jgi:hypothetical protein
MQGRRTIRDTYMYPLSSFMPSSFSRCVKKALLYPSFSSALRFPRLYCVVPEGKSSISVICGMAQVMSASLEIGFGGDPNSSFQKRDKWVDGTHDMKKEIRVKRSFEYERRVKRVINHDVFF